MWFPGRRPFSGRCALRTFTVSCAVQCAAPVLRAQRDGELVPVRREMVPCARK
jgi:hypothetical protein